MKLSDFQNISNFKAVRHIMSDIICLEFQLICTVKIYKSTNLDFSKQMVSLSDIMLFPLSQQNSIQLSFKSSPSFIHSTRGLRWSGALYKTRTLRKQKKQETKLKIILDHVLVQLRCLQAFIVYFCICLFICLFVCIK